MFIYACITQNIVYVYVYIIYLFIILYDTNIHLAYDIYVHMYVTRFYQPLPYTYTLCNIHILDITHVMYIHILVITVFSVRVM